MDSQTEAKRNLCPLHRREVSCPKHPGKNTPILSCSQREKLPRKVFQLSAPCARVYREQCLSVLLNALLNGDWGYRYGQCDCRTLHEAQDAACVDACPVDCIHAKKNTTCDDGRPTFDAVSQFYIGSIFDERKDCAADHPAFRTVPRLIPTGAVSASSRVVWCSSDSN